MSKLVDLGAQKRPGIPRLEAIPGLARMNAYIGGHLYLSKISAASCPGGQER